jgi:hypothetical protein
MEEMERGRKFVRVQKEKAAERVEVKKILGNFL